MLRRRRVGTSTADVTNRRTQLRQLIDPQALTTVQISGKLQQQQHRQQQNWNKY